MAWVLCGVGFGLVLHLGCRLPPPSHQSQISVVAASNDLLSKSAANPTLRGSPWSALVENLNSPLSRLLAQLLVIVFATRTTGSLFRKIGLPSVVGEIAAGILLGPSLFGWLWPRGFAFLFTPASLDVLKLLSQVGVVVFMFVVGMELKVGHLRDKVRTAFLVSLTGILVPFLMGMTASLYLYDGYARAGTSFTSFALFIGIALSITAFPVLVRILEERGMANSPLGNAAITCAAVGDASAWAILALVVAFVRAEGMKAILYNFALLTLFVSFMLIVVRRCLPKLLGPDAGDRRRPSSGFVACVLLFMSGSALVTEVLGIHALFGAFLAGAIMPKNKGFRRDLVVRMENFTNVLLMPLFFAFSGLRTHIGMLNDTRSWFVCLVVVVVATAGKMGSSMFAARLTGMGWNDSFAFGALMNTRGLMELIALNIGYDLGILPSPIFTILVLMALITTFSTGPLLNLAARLGPSSKTTKDTAAA